MTSAEITKAIWTIGHSTRPISEFVALLQSFQIKTLADIRAYPGSAKHPQFNKPELEHSLISAGIAYLHLRDLGGRRKPRPDSKNTIWKNTSFRGYADYMETDDFLTAVRQLEVLALTSFTAMMCSEAVWWRCHRALVSDYLKLQGWQVLHIMNEDKVTEHPFTQPARDNQGKLF